MYIYEDATLLEHLDPMIKLINDEDLNAESFRSLLKRDGDKFCFNVTSNQFKRIHHYLITSSMKKPDLWANPLFTALCMNERRAHEIDKAALADYLSEVEKFYTSVTLVQYAPSELVGLDDIKLFDSDIKKIVIAEEHGTRAPLALLRASVGELVTMQAAVSLEGLSLEEIEEIDYCNKVHACSLLLYMLIPVEKSIRGDLVALEKRQLVASLIRAGIKIIPGDNKYSVNLPAGSQRLRQFNYSALQNAYEGPIVFLVGKAHAVKTRNCPGMASILGAKLIDLTGAYPLVNKPVTALPSLHPEHNEGSPTHGNVLYDGRSLVVLGITGEQLHKPLPIAENAPEIKIDQMLNMDNPEHINLFFRIYFDYPKAYKAILAGLVLAVVVIASIATFGAATVVATAGGALGFAGANATYAGTAALATMTCFFVGGCTFFATGSDEASNENECNSDYVPCH